LRYFGEKFLKLKYLIPFAGILLIGLVVAVLNTPEAPNVNPTNAEPAAPFPLAMAIFETDNGLLYMIYPDGWATRQTPAENGFTFKIVPQSEQLDADPNNYFDENFVMVYGAVRQVAPELADAEHLEGLHADTFFSDQAEFSYTLVADPVIDSDKPGIIYYYTQVESTLPSGVHTNWMLGTALTNQTVASFAVGLSDSALEEYGEMAMAMFNSIEVDTALAEQLME
jgi:hypothetical protein